MGLQFSPLHLSASPRQLHSHLLSWTIWESWLRGCHPPDSQFKQLFRTLLNEPVITEMCSSFSKHVTFTNRQQVVFHIFHASCSCFNRERTSFIMKQVNSLFYISSQLSRRAPWDCPKVEADFRGCN